MILCQPKTKTLPIAYIVKVYKTHSKSCLILRVKGAGGERFVLNASSLTVFFFFFKKNLTAKFYFNLGVLRVYYIIFNSVKKIKCLYSQHFRQNKL